MRHYTKIVRSEAEYEAVWKALINAGFWAQGWGTDYARYRRGEVEVRIVRCYRCE